VIKEPIVMTKSKPTKPGSHKTTRSASHKSPATHGPTRSASHKSSATHGSTRSTSRESSHTMTRHGSSRDRQ
jgi:hypothetical protein